MKLLNHYKATALLGGVTIGYFASVPFSHTFWGGLVSSACGAAVIGGFADWFAVSALFRKPLGIPVRTAIIPRNRDKILKAISDMIEYELLNADNVRRTLAKQDVAELLLNYLRQRGGLEDVRDIIVRLAIDMLEKGNSDEIGRMVDKQVKNLLGKSELALLLAKGLAWMLQHGYEKNILDFVIAEVHRIISRPQMRQFLQDTLEGAIKTYEQDRKRRKLATFLLEQSGLSTLQMAEILQRKLQEYLAAIQAPQHPAREALRQWVTGLQHRLQTDKDLQAAMEAWKDEVLIRQLELRHSAAQVFCTVRDTSIGQPQQMECLTQRLVAKMDKALGSMLDDPNKRQAMNNTLVEWLVSWIDANHYQIGRIVQQKMSNFTDRVLVEFIERRVGNDLQMIRINGSVVGGLVGAAIFLLTFWL